MKRTNFSTDFVTDVAESLRRYCQGKANRRDTNRLIELGAVIIRQKLWGRLNAAARVQGTSVDQQAMSMLAGLFSESNTGSPLRRALADHMEADDIELFMRFRAVVVHFASQELFHRWGESDPIGAKLWRNLRHALNRDPRLVVFPAEHPEWVALADADDLCPSNEPLELHDLKQLLFEIDSGRFDLARMTWQVLEHIARNPNVQKAIRIEYLFQAMREVVMQSTREEVKARHEHSHFDPSLEMAVDKAQQSAQNVIAENLRRLQERERLTAEWIDVFGKALLDVVEDSVDGGPAQSYYQYLRRYKPELSRQYYRDNLRTRFEYLAEIAQKEFYREIRRQLSE